MKKLKIVLQFKYLFIIILLISFIYAFIRIYLIKYTSYYKGSEKYIIGYIDKVIRDDEKYKITINGREKIICYYKSSYDYNFKLGTKVKIYGDLYKPQNNTIPNTFNYKSYLNNHYIYHLMKAHKIILFKNKISLIYQIKNYINQRIENYKYVKDYLKAFILGDKTELEEYQVYQKNGVAHLFALSGMHVGLLSSFILFFFKKSKLKNVIVILFLLLYSQIVNYSASMNRSILFFILIIINQKRDLNIKTIDILLLTISLLIIGNPLIIYDLGFIYSVAATTGLILGNKYYRHHYFFNLLIVSTLAFLFTLPITLSFNYEFNVLSIFNNLIVVPIITFLIYPFCLLCFILSFLEPILFLFIQLLELINNFLDSLRIMIIIPKINMFYYAFYYILLYLFIKSNNYKLLLINMALILCLKIKPFLDNNTYVYYLSVGQGDSTLIYNKKETILIDTGGLYNFNISDNTIKFMKSLGLNHIDLLLLTHGDSDHIKDATNIIDNYHIKNVMLNNNQYNKLEKEIIKTDVHLVKKYHSQMNFRIYNNYVGKDENASSIICSLKINNYYLLFMGDAPIEEEKIFLKKYHNKTTILKLGHHGSKTSTDYNILKQINPQVGIISSGLNNIYHLPSKSTIYLLKKLKIKYYDTQDFGTICYCFRQNKYSQKTYNP